jgi:hypothetical protein
MLWKTMERTMFIREYSNKLDNMKCYNLEDTDIETLVQQRSRFTIL